MSIRLNNFVEGEYYHLYNRGNSKQTIFKDAQDHEHFIYLLNVLNTCSRVRLKRSTFNETVDDPLVSIGAYCLMPNHFHILITQETEKGISTFMQKVSTAYVMYYNRKYKRTGGLFEGKFKSKYITGDTYLQYLFSYIHMNPLKIIDNAWKRKAKHLPKEMFQFLNNYKYSSFNEYFSNEFFIVNKEAFPEYFPTKESFTKSITTWFNDHENI